MKTRAAISWTTLLTMIPATWAVSQFAYAGDPGFHFSSSVMALTNSTSQGGSGPSGSTVLTHSELHYHWNWWGLGTYFQYDRQGSNETDTAFGPKLELHGGPFYAEFGYAAIMQRAFTDRSIARQTGSGLFYGIGVRFRLGSSSSGMGGGPGFFLQSSYKFRTQKIIKQDGADLGEPIQQKDGYPLFGIGYVF